MIIPLSTQCNNCRRPTTLLQSHLLVHSDCNERSEVLLLWSDILQAYSLPNSMVLAVYEGDSAIALAKSLAFSIVQFLEMDTEGISYIAKLHFYEQENRDVKSLMHYIFRACPRTDSELGVDSSFAWFKYDQEFDRFVIEKPVDNKSLKFSEIVTTLVDKSIWPGLVRRNCE